VPISIAIFQYTAWRNQTMKFFPPLRHSALLNLEIVHKIFTTHNNKQRGPIMRIQFARLALVAVLAITWSGCSTSTAFINPETMDSTVQVRNGSFNGSSLGVAKGDEGGAIWTNCSEKAAESVRSMIAQAKGAGANAIGNLKWYASGTSVPSCKKGWGYLVVWPFVLTPLFMSTAVTGDMYKVSGKSHAGMIMLPESAEAQLALAKKIVAGI
jgi:hypothetical protein